MSKTFDISALYNIDPNNGQYFPTGFNMTVVWFTATDIDGDGFDEFILAGHNSQQDSENPSIVFNVGQNLQLSVATDIIQPGSETGLVWPRWFLTADFNGDGFNDVFVAATGFDYAPWPGEPNLLLLSDGTGGLVASPLPYEVGEFSHSAASGDIDGDGDLDIYVGNVGGQNILPYLLINGGNGAFSLTRGGLPASVVASDGREPWQAAMYDSAIFEDFDGDGAVDLVLGNFSSSASNPSYIYFNNGTGGFRDTDRRALPNPAELGASSTSYDLEAMDVDGDGDLDLFNVYTPHDDTRGWEIQLLINDGNGNFTDETSSHFRPGETHETNVNYFMSFLTLIDVNNDGFLDLVGKYIGAANASTAPAMWLNDGTGGFAAITNEELFPDDHAWLAGRQFQPVITPLGVEFIVPFDIDGNLINDPITLTATVYTGPYGQNPADQGAAGFNELYYLNHNSDASGLVDSGTYATGLAHYLAVGAAEGRLGFADGATISATDEDNSLIAANGNGLYKLLGGNDSFLGSFGDEVVFAGDGNDFVNAGDGDDTIHGGAGNDTLNGGAGNDTVVIGATMDSATVRGFLEGVIVSSAEGSDVIISDIEEIRYTDTMVSASTLTTKVSIFSYGASHIDLINFLGTDEVALLRHFADYAEAEGRAITFDGLDYIASHGDLVSAIGTDETAGAMHFIQYGHGEGRQVTFDGLDYIASYGDLINAIGTDETAGATHFIQYGHGEGRQVTFDGLDYIASYGDLINAIGTDETAGATHFIQYGHGEGRQVTFDGLDYIASYGDLIHALGANEEAGAIHFITNGFSEGRQTTFDAAAYLSAHSDLQQAFGNDLEAATIHYIEYGFDEGRVF